MKYSKLKKALLRTLVMTLVLVMPWANAFAADVTDWAGIVNAYNGWQSTEFTLMEDVTAESVIDVPSWRPITITLNDHTLTPPAGYDSAFGGDKKAIYVVDDAAEFANAAADPGSSTIKLAGDITLTGSVVLKNAQTIETGSYTLTLDAGAEISAEVSTYAALKDALANSSITSVKLAADIVATENCTVDLAKVDLGTYSITTQYDNQKVTMLVYNEDQLTAAVGMTRVVAQLQNNITLTSDLVLDDVNAIDANGYALTGADVVAEVDTYEELKAALANSSITSVKVTGNIVATENCTVDLAKVDLGTYSITTQYDNQKVTMLVYNEDQLTAAVGMTRVVAQLQNNITLTSDLVLDDVNAIDANGYALTGADVVAEVDTYEELKAALANSSITSVKLTGNIQTDNGYTIDDLSRIDFNGYSIAPRQNDWTINVAVTNEAELNQVLAMSNAVAVLQNNIALSGDLVLEDVSRVNTNGNDFTGAQLIVEVDTYNEFKTAMNSDAVDVVRMTSDIESGGWDTYDNISKLDTNGYALKGGAQLTFNVNTQEELALALAQPATNKAVLQNNIRLDQKVEVSNLGKIDLNNKNLTKGPEGGLVVGVTQEYDITNALALDYVYGVKLMRDITLTSQVNVDDLAQIDENGYTLSFSGNGKVALNVSNEQELRAALANPDVEYINMTNDIRLRQQLTITAGSAQVISNGYKLTGAKVVCNVDSWEALKAACALGLPGAEITLTGDITQGEGSAEITADTTINLHNQKLVTSEETVFNVRSGKLKITDTVPAQGGWGGGAKPMQDYWFRDDDTFCKMASISNSYWGRQLSYYVTTSQIVATGGYANAGTRETRVQYNYGGGIIDARDAENPIFNVGRDGELEITGGAYFGSKNRAIYADGNVTLSGDTVFANNSSGNGGAVYMNGGKLTIKARVQGGNPWEGDVHGVVFTGNHASAGASGGAIYIGEWAEMEMNGGYVTNNWCDEAEGDAGWSGGGGIAVLGDLTMNDGYVTANKAIGGGGIKTIINGNWDDGGAFQMNGGIVAGNLATKYEGGGIVINHSGYGKITGGYITNNETATTQHWGGGGIFISDYGYMDMEAVFVINNEAGGYGGGVAGCSTGRIDTHDTSDNIAHSTAIFDNTAAGEHMSGTESTKDVDRIYAFNDPVFNRDNGAHYQDYFCALSSYICGGMLGNGTANWSGTIDGEPIHQNTIEKDDVVIGVSITGLTNHSTQTDRNNAHKAAKVFVSGNESYTHGGGVLCNGYLVIGHEHHATIGDRMSVSGRKEASGFNLEEGAFGFYLIQDLNGNREPDELYFTDLDAERYGVPFVTTATNDADGLVEFAHRIPFADDGKFYYMIFEASGYEAGMTYDQSSYLLTVTVGREVLTVVETPDGGKHDIIAEPKIVTFYRIEKVEVAKKEAGASSYGESTTVFNEVSSANNSVDLVDLFTFYNKKEKPEYVDITVTKKWVDNSDQDGLRPDSITVQLLADGVEVEGEAVDLTGEGDDWTYTWKNLPKKANGVEIVYTVKEIGKVEGYTTAYSEDTLTITNTHITETTEVTVTKKWVDNSNQDGVRPEKITVQLLADGVEVEGESVDLTGEGDDWTYTWTNLPKKANGVEIVYTVKEIGKVEGYTTAYSEDTLTITNTHITETTDVTVTKKWVDNSDQDGVRPEKITVQLLADGVEVEGESVDLTGEGDDWTYTWTNLPKKANGVEIVYTVKEIGKVEGYTTAYSEDTLTITNTHETDETQITVTKKWVDNGDQDGLRPAEISVQLLANGEAKGEPIVLTGEGDEWTYTWKNLPKKADGTDIVYTVKELGEIVGYTTAYSDDTLTITNTHETDETQITVTKKWVDNGDQDGLRPDSITVQLLADGEAKGEPVVLTGEGDEWTYTWKNLPKKADGTDIVYTVKELGEIVGYTTAYSDDTLTITNTHETDETQITVTKKWVDNGDQDGLRPDSITVQLLADGEAEGEPVVLTGEGDEWTYTWKNLPKKADGTDIVYTVKEIGEVVGYTTAYSEDTLTITNTHETDETQITVTKKWVDNGDQDGLRPDSITVQLLADGEAKGEPIVLTGETDEWTHTWTKLPKKADGKDVVYTVKELGEIVGYTTAYSEDTLTITNTHETDETQITVTKKWVDNSNQDGVRPDSITVQLLADGEAKGEPVVLTGEGNEWTYTWKNLPKKADGKDVVYTVKELGEIVGYTTAYSDDTLTITNTHETDETQITVTKKWVDNGDQDGLRPAEISVQLLANGEAEGEPVILTGETDEWTYTWKNLPKKADGKDVVYTVKELGEIVGYTTAYSEDTLTITNTHETDETQITVTKKWVDNGDQDGLRPAEISVQLLANGEAKGEPVVLTGETDEWTYTWKNLPKKVDGTDIVYTVKELGKVEGYTTAYSEDTLTITNTHETDETQITVTKKWVDNGDQDGLRPDSITVQLLADGVEVEGETVDLTGEGDEWTYTWKNLPKKADGTDIVYTVKELGEIVGYTTAYSEDTLTITNTHETDETQITVTKKWVDNGDQDGLRPAEISVQLLANGEAKGEPVVLTGEGNEWTYTWKNLPKKADGKDVVYTVKELGEIVGYTTAYSEDTLTITNTHETDETQITVTKKWVDNGDQDGLRPDSITVQLLADGEAKGEPVVLTGEGDEWTYTWKNLPKKADGKDVVYTVKELGEIVGYTTAYSEDTLTITNTHETDETQITVTKKWVDNGDQDGLRPAEISVQLLANGEAKGEPIVLTGETDEWTYTWKNLPKKANGVDIVYTVKEIGEIVGYTTAYSEDTLTITNTHETDETQITVTKKWVDNGDQDGLRPEKITVQLLADGVEVEGKTADLTGEGNEWTYTWKNLPKKADGKDVVYTVKELGEIVGYTTAYSEDTLTITNTHETDETQITVTKKWVDNGDQDGLRPAEISVQLLANGEAKGEPIVLTGETDEWTYTWKNLPKKANGVDIVYTVKEIGEIVGYTTAYSEDTLTITNTHETDETQITVTKKWVDNGDQDGLRPAEISVQLLANGEAKGEAVVLTGEGNEWTYTWKNLPKKADGKDVVYTVKELGEIVGYTTAYSEDTLTITNTHETDETQITVTKKWVDNGDQDGLRPAEISVQLLANGEAKGEPIVLTGETDEWTYTWKNLPKKVDGTDIVYTVKELGEIVGYTTAYSEDTLTITNTHETDETQITVTKKWVDNGDQDGLRPDSITVQLLANGEAEGEPVVLTGETDEWTYTWKNLPKKVDGTDIVYTVKELGEIVGYTTAYSEDTLTITNTHETDETQITVTKKWVDNGDQDGLRPAEISVQLLANGEAKGEAVVLTGEGNEWTYTWKNLPKKADGKDVVYTVKELGEIVGYTTAYSEDTLTITNTHETATVSLSVEKVWDDSNNIAGKRAESIEVQLMADGKPVAGQTITLNKENDWKGSWTELDKYAAGELIVYSVEEVTVPEGYTSKLEMTEVLPGHFQVKITNTYAVDKTQITVTKKWLDANNYDGIRPRSITVQLVADGTPVEGMTAVMTGAGNEWTYTFTDLPKYAEGEEGKLIQYTVKELGEIVGYTTAYSEDELTITNTHELYKRYTIAVKKNDAVNPDKVIAGAKFAVYSDADCTQLVDTITTDAQGEAELGNLLAGTYYLVEIAAPAGYQLDSSVHAVEAGENTDAVVTVDLVNYPLIGSLTLKKTVVGDGTGLSFIFDVALDIDTGDKLAGVYNATLNGAATTVTFTDTANGAEASVTLKDGDVLTILGLRTGTNYTVTEQPGEFYTTTVNGAAGNAASGVITESSVSIAAFENKLQLTDFSVKKEWHGMDEGEIAPEISLILYCNGEVYTTVTPKPTVGGWYIYEDLPTLVDGVKAVYTVVEQPVDGFTTTYVNTGDNAAEVDCACDGGTIMNSKIPQTGDNAHLTLWMTMLLLSAAALMGVMAHKRRKAN